MHKHTNSMPLDPPCMDCKAVTPAHQRELARVDAPQPQRVVIVSLHGRRLHGQARAHLHACNPSCLTLAPCNPTQISSHACMHAQQRVCDCTFCSKACAPAGAQRPGAAMGDGACDFHSVMPTSRFSVLGTTLRMMLTAMRSSSSVSTSSQDVGPSK